MTHQQAVKIAVQCMRAEIQRLAVPANLQERYQANLPSTISARDRRAALRQAIAILQGQPTLPVRPEPHP